MIETNTNVKPGIENTALLLSEAGKYIFSFSILAVGVETIVCANFSAHSLGEHYNTLPLIPWLPPIPFIAYIFGLILIACGAGLLNKSSIKISSLILGSLLTLCALIIVLPKSAAEIQSVGLRTVFLEPITIASFGLLLAGKDKIPGILISISRYLLAFSLIVFGVDHFLIIPFIASLIPGWIPWHTFWSFFFGIVFIAGGIGIGINYLVRWSTFGIGLMFGLWVITLHIPRTLGFLGIPGAIKDPEEWSSLFIAIAIWGGSWALVKFKKI